MKHSFVFWFLLLCAQTVYCQTATNKALQFDGVDDCLAVYNGSNMPSNDFSFEAWLKVTPGANEGLVYGNYWPFRITVGPSSVSCGLSDKGNLTVDTADNTAGWVYIVFTKSGSRLIGYRNGVRIGTTTVASGTIDFSGSGIGAEPLDGGSSQSNFKGSIDEIRISSIARSATEIQANWNSGNGKMLKADANTSALWHFNETPAPYVIDVSPYGHVAQAFPAYPANGGTQLTGFSFPAPIGDMAVFVPDLTARLGIRPYVLISGAAATDKFVAQLDGAIVYRQKGPLPEKVKFPINLRNLANGSHTLTFELRAKNNSLLQSISKTYNKPVSGIAHAAIDEDNAVNVDGVRTPFLFYPFVADPNLFQPGTGWIDYTPIPVTALMFPNFIDGGRLDDPVAYTNWGWDAFGFYGIMPGQGFDDIPFYVNELKDLPGMLLYGWTDEPELAGYNADTVRQWTTDTRALDPQHPVIINFAGFEAETPSLFWENLAASYFPISNLVADIYSFDYYPKNATGPNSENITLDQAFANLATICDSYRAWSFGQVPVYSFIQTCQIGLTDPPAPTPTELAASFWINLIHGVHGIGWFSYFQETPQSNFQKMSSLVDQTNRLSSAILSSDLDGTVTKQELGGGRIDIMTKAYNGLIYIFAVNMKKAAQSCTFTFNANLSGTMVDVFDENRTIPLSGQSFTDSFGKYAVHIYSIDGMPHGAATPVVQTQNNKADVIEHPLKIKVIPTLQSLHFDISVPHDNSRTSFISQSQKLPL